MRFLYDREAWAASALILFLALSGANAAATCTKTYTVKSGDGCLAIADNNGIYYAQLLALNPSIGSNCNIAIGQTLCLVDTTVPACAKTVAIASGQGCSTIATANSISLASFMALNPYINSGCSNIYVADNVCVKAGAVTTSTTSTKTSTTSPTATATGPATCTKKYTVQSGDGCLAIADNNGIYYAQLLALNPTIGSNCNINVGETLCLVDTTVPACAKTVAIASGQGCSTIATANAITLAQFMSLNPYINSGCSNVFVSDNVCVQAGVTTTSTSTTPTTITSTATPTPTPYGCFTAYTVQSGDTCSAISSSHGIYEAQLIAINPSLNSSCVLQLNHILCLVDTTCPACSKTAAVQQGQGCVDVATANNITTAQLLTLNPYVNSGCSNIVAGDNLCVVKGTRTSSSTVPLTTSTSTTSWTPAPTGICTKSYTVRANDTCTIISQAYRVYLGQLYSLNPSVNAQCTNLQISQSLCISSSTVPACGGTYIVGNLETCAVIAAKNSMSLPTFLKMNPFINGNCSNLFPGDYVCVKNGGPSPPVCSSNYTMNPTDNCNTFESKFQIPTAVMMACNPGLNCNASLTGQTLCSSCQYTYPACTKLATSVNGDTCATVAAKNSISLSQFNFWNSLTDCTVGLPAGQTFCVASNTTLPTSTTSTSTTITSTSTAPASWVPTPTCATTYKWTSSDTCTAFQQQEGIPSDEFLSCNPGISCSTGGIAAGTNICASCQYSSPYCSALTHATTHNQSFSNFASSMNLTLQEFQLCNPVTDTTKPTIQYGYFYCTNCTLLNPSGCAQTYVVKAKDTCASIIASQQLYTAQFLSNNFGLNCSVLQVGQSVCVESVNDPTCYSKATVTSGQSCNSIAAAYSLPIEQLLSLNPDLSLQCQNLYVDDNLCVAGPPTFTTSTPTPVVTCTAQYTIALGDTCGKIAANANTYIGQIVGLNTPAINSQCTNIIVGQVICTASSQVPVCNKRVAVQAGQGCGAFAQANNVPSGLAGLLAFNPFISPDCSNIYPGDYLCVSSNAIIPTATTTAIPTATWVPPPVILLGCAKNYTATANDNCTTISEQFGISTLVLKQINTGLNCTNLSGQTICLAQDLPACKNTYISGVNQTCAYITSRYGIDTDTFLSSNPDIDCVLPLPTGQRVCIDNPYANCTSVYTSQAGDSCYLIQNENGLSLDDFNKLNPVLNCNVTMSAGTKVCVAGSLTHCAQTYITKLGDTCSSLTSAFSLRKVTAFMNLNPSVNCSAAVIPPNVQVCVQSNARSGCGDLYTVSSNDTCTSIANNFGITVDILDAINPGLVCSALNSNQQLCVGASPPQCRSTAAIQANNTCVTLQNSYNLTATQFYVLNPFIDCSTNLTVGQPICLSALPSSGPSHQFLSSAIQQLGSLNPQLATLYQQFQQNPTQATQNILINSMLGTLASNQSLPLLMQLTQTDPYFKALESQGVTQRQQSCQFTANKTNMATSNSCFCGTQYPLVYCMSIYYQQMQGFLGKSSATAKANTQTKQLVPRMYKDQIVDRFQSKYPQYLQARSDRQNERQRKNAKRHPLTYNNTQHLSQRGNPSLLEWCNPEDPNIQENISDPELEHCTTDSCEWPVWEIIEIKVTETWCITNDAQYNGQSVAFAEDDFVAVALEACLSDPELDAALAEFDLSPICAGADGKWYPGRGVLDLEGDVDILILHARAGGTIKLWESEEAFCSGPERCQKEFCYMDMFHFYEEVHVWVDLWIFGTKDIYGPRTYSLPQCNPNDGGYSVVPGSHPYGKVIKGYYPNWTFYHNNNQIIEITSDMATMLTHINYAFAMVSYQPDLDVYYLDPSDLYADVGTCASLLDIQCLLSNLFGEDTTTCMPIDATAQCAPGVISLVPYWGAKNADGSCPVPSKNCYNAGGPAGGRNPSCTTQLDGTTLKESQDDTTILACGQFNYLFNLMDQSNAGASNIRIMLSIGGWYDASYFTPATDDAHYEAFTDSIVSILEFFPFDGIDIDWEFPGFEHGDEPVYGAVGVGDREVTQDCIATTCQYPQRRNDPAQYVRFLQTLRAKLDTAGPYRNGLNRHGDKYEISIAAASGWDKYQYLDKAAVCQTITHVNMMSYDMHGAWDTITNHQAPIYDNTPNAVGRQYSIDDAITGWTQGGCDASKIVLGIPLYSRTEIGVSPGYAYGDANSYPGLYQPFSGPQEDATVMPTFGQLVSDPSWTTYWDPYSQASWAWNPSQNAFASYDSERAIKNKMCYIGEKGLAGAMYWLMGQDSSDNRGLKAMASNLGCTTPEPKMTNPPPTTECNANTPLSKRAPSCPVGATPYYDMTIHMVQVGRGDAFLLEFNHYQCTGVPAVDDQSTCGNPVNARVFLIDGGSQGQGSSTGRGNVYDVVNSLGPVIIGGVDQDWKIDYVIATHSDSDHIGGLNDLLYENSNNGRQFFRSTATATTFFIHDNPYDPALRSAIGVTTSTVGASSCGRLYSPGGALNTLSAQAYNTAIGIARGSSIYSQFLANLKYYYTQGVKLAWDSTSTNQAFSTTYSDDLNLAPLLVKNLGAPAASLKDALSNPLFCGVGGAPNTQTSVAVLSNMVSTITEFTWGTSKLLFTGDANMQEFSYSGGVAFQQHYRFLKVPHHCSPDSMTPDGSDYYTLTADFYLISGQTQGSTLQPGALCLNAIIQQRVNRARDLGLTWHPAQIFLTNYDDASTQVSSNNPLDATISSLNPVAYNYRLYVLNAGITEALFTMSSATGEVILNANDFTDLTARFFPGLPNTYTLANQAQYPNYVKFP